MKREKPNAPAPPTPKELLKRVKTLEQQVLSLIDAPHEYEEEEADSFIHFKSGNRTFTTVRSTINRYPESILYLMVNGRVPCKKVGNAFYVDMRPGRFVFVFDYIQTGQSPAMSKTQQENFKEDLQYFQLPYMGPMTPVEQKAKSCIDEWLNSPTTDVKLADETNLYYNVLQISPDALYSSYARYCGTYKKKKVNEDVFWNVARSIGIGVTPKRVLGIINWYYKWDDITKDDLTILATVWCAIPIGWLRRDSRFWFLNKISGIIGYTYGSSDCSKWSRFLKQSRTIMVDKALETAIRNEWKASKSITTAKAKIQEFFCD